jgi:hypothetical protein
MDARKRDLVPRVPEAAEILNTAIAVLTGMVATSLVAVGLQRSRDRDALTQTRTAATGRIGQAADIVSRGDHEGARTLLAWPDPILESRPELQDVRDRRGTLRAQVSVYAEFKQLLDDARFDCRFGSPGQKKQGQLTCRKLLELYDDIERRQGRAADGLPPLNDEQQLRFKEDAFEAFLVAALVDSKFVSVRLPGRLPKVPLNVSVPEPPTTVVAVAALMPVMVTASPPSRQSTSSDSKSA